MTDLAALPTLLRDGAGVLGIDLNEAHLDAFRIYARTLLDWNQRLNLTAITEPDEIAVKHFLDALSINPHLPALPPDFALIDVGSGAGLPGLPLKIIRPALRLTLLEARAKKTAFLQHMIEALNVAGATVVTARAEEAGHQPVLREQYDLAIARAVAPLPVLAEYMLPLVKVGGWMAAQKGLHPGDEIKAAANALDILGGGLPQVRPLSVPGLAAARHLVLIQKVEPTPSMYPRRPGLPSKKPL